MATLPNYNNDVLMRVQGSPVPPVTPGFTTINPTTGATNMLPYTQGMGAGIFNQIINDPNRLGSLLGTPGASTALRGTLPSSVPGGAGGAIGGSGGNPAALTGPGGVNPTPGPNPLPGVDPSGQLPSYILNQFSSNLAGALRGELPEDVQNMLAQQSAEYGVGSGTQGSQFQGYRGLRNLGLTSLDRMKDAEALVAGQFTKPADKIALDQSAQKIKDLEDQFNKTFGLEKQKLADQLKLEKDKFAAYQNELNRKYQMDSLASLESLGLKYGGGGLAAGGATPLRRSSSPGTTYSIGPTGQMTALSPSEFFTQY